MCFYNDYDFFYQECSQVVCPAKADTFCIDCRAPIKQGETCEQHDCQQYEECRCCHNDNDEVDYDRECRCEKPDYGIEDEFSVCEDCRRFRLGIEALEISRGCRRDEANPAYGELYDSLDYFDDEDIEAYLGRTREMFPDLVTPEFADRTWRLIRPREKT